MLRMRRGLTLLLVVTLGLGSGIVGGELLLRASGWSPGPVPVPADYGATALQPPNELSPETGWQLKVGRHEVTQAGRAVTITVAADGSRRSAPGPASVAASPGIIFLGDSCTFGHGLFDEETLPWQVQQAIPGEQVANFAVGGFGTCQVLLRLRSLLRPGPTGRELRPRFVVYGFSQFQESRSIADPREDYWLAMASPRRSSLYPRCTLAGGEVVTQPPQQWSVLLPFTGHLALARLLTNARLEWLARPRLAEQRGVSEVLLRTMHQVAREHGATLLVLLQYLDEPALTHYRGFLAREGISFVDGAAVAARPDLRLEDGHPAPGMVEVWSRQLVELLKHPEGAR